MAITIMVIDTGSSRAFFSVPSGRSFPRIPKSAFVGQSSISVGRAILVLGQVGSVLFAATLTAATAGAQSMERPATQGAAATDTTQTTASAPEEPRRYRRFEAWAITPSIRFTETYSDNVTQTPSAEARGGWITSVSPGIRLRGVGPRVSGLVDYRLHALRYSDQLQPNSTQNALNSFISVEALDDWFFVDVRANISQQNRSAFSSSVTNDAATGSNRSETSAVQLSPHLRGRVPDMIDYQLRFSGTEGHVSGGVVPATRTTEWVGRIKNAPTSSPFGWTLDGTQIRIRNSSIGEKEDSRVHGSVIYDVMPDLHVLASYGQEVTDFADLAKRRSRTTGLGFEWSPSVRTQFAAVKTRRFFGDGHSVGFKHRTARVAWNLTDVRDANAMPNQLLAADGGSAFELMADLLASGIPDPVAREKAVNARFEQAGIHGGSNLLTGGFVTSRVFVSRNRQASVLMLGRVSTVTLTLNRRDAQALGAIAATGADSFSASRDIRQQNLSAAWSYQLSPFSSVTLVASRLRTEGLSTAGLDSQARLHSLLFSTQLAPRLHASLAFRNRHFDSSSGGGFRENALAGTLALSL